MACFVMTQRCQWDARVNECCMFYAVPTARVIFTAKTSLEVFSLKKGQVWTFSILGDRINEMRCLFVAAGPNARFIVLPHWDNMSHYTVTGLTCYILWCLLHRKYHASRDHSHFQHIWYDWTQHQPGIEPIKPLGQCWESECWEFFYAVSRARVIFMAKTSLDFFSPG